MSWVVRVDGEPSSRTSAVGIAEQPIEAVLTERAIIEDFVAQVDYIFLVLASVWHRRDDPPLRLPRNPRVGNRYRLRIGNTPICAPRAETRFRRTARRSARAAFESGRRTRVKPGVITATQEGAPQRANSTGGQRAARRTTGISRSVFAS